MLPRDRIPVFVIDAYTERDHVIFCSPSSFSRSNLFLDIGDDRVVRVRIPTTIALPAGYVVSHHRGRLANMVPIPQETVDELKKASFTQRVVKRALKEVGGDPYRRRSKYFVAKRSRLAEVSY